MSSHKPQIILYHYPFSPYAQRVQFYLTLRSLPYQQCLQPPMLPRPDIFSLGITYRRIPLLAVGNTVIADSSLILSELESRFPEGRLGGGAEALKWESASIRLTKYAVGCIPSSLPLMNDPAFRKDREEFSGASLSLEPAKAEKRRAAALQGLERGFQAVEDALADGRRWILGSNDPTMADINAVWVLNWIMGMPGALEGSPIGEGAFPHTYALVARFHQKMGKPMREPVVTGEQAKELILHAPKEEPEDGRDPRREIVVITPVDTGKSHPQMGRVRARGAKNIVLAVTPPGGGKGEVNMMFPLKGYEVVVVKECGANL